MIKQVEILLIGYQSLGPNLERLWYHSDTSNKVAFYYSRRRNIGSFFYFFSKWLLEMVTRNGFLEILWLLQHTPIMDSE